MYNEQTKRVSIYLIERLGGEKCFNVCEMGNYWLGEKVEHLHTPLFINPNATKAVKISQ